MQMMSRQSLAVTMMDARAKQDAYVKNQAVRVAELKVLLAPLQAVGHQMQLPMIQLVYTMAAALTQGKQQLSIGPARLCAPCD